jgi:hypothetical protein
MPDVEEIWRRKADDEVLLAASSLSEYTEQGQQVILAEAGRRGLDVKPILRARAALDEAMPQSSGRCAYCDTRIFFGGTREGQFTFCSQACRQAGIRLAVSRQAPDGVVNERLWAAFHGTCPKCGGRGPVDVHTSHRVYSMLIATSWSSRVAVVCTPCGRNAKVRDALLSFALGWWALPWGIVMTPIQCGRNIAGLLERPDDTRPSKHLERVVRLSLAEELLLAAPPERGDALQRGRRSG